MKLKPFSPVRLVMEPLVSQLVDLRIYVPLVALRLSAISWVFCYRENSGYG